MPSAHRSLTQGDVRRFVAERCFATASGKVGAELEWLTMSRDDPHATPAFDLVKRTVESLGSLPGGSLVTYEPGGQIELSSIPGDDAGEACRRLQEDEHAIRTALARQGIELAAIGLDPVRSHSRVLHLPRYAAMEQYFDQAGPEGRRMMCRTAAVQINVDSGTGEAARRRWDLVHRIGPVLAAMFANSPFFEGRATGWHSTRLATWWAMDRTRTRPASSGDPIESWSTYLLDARVMFVRVRPDWYEPVAEPMTFRRWMENGHEQGFPTIEDLDYHTTTVFPPIRPRGWLELRMVDASPWWPVAVAVTSALLDHDDAAARATEACRETDGVWLTSSRCALEHPPLAKAARACMAAALEAMSQSGFDAELEKAAFSFADRFTFRGRSPSHDLLDVWATTGRMPTESKTMASVWS